MGRENTMSGECLSVYLFSGVRSAEVFSIGIGSLRSNSLDSEGALVLSSLIPLSVSMGVDVGPLVLLLVLGLDD